MSIFGNQTYGATKFVDEEEDDLENLDHLVGGGKPREKSQSINAAVRKPKKKYKFYNDTHQDDEDDLYYGTKFRQEEEAKWRRMKKRCAVGLATCSVFSCNILFLLSILIFCAIFFGVLQQVGKFGYQNIFTTTDDFCLAHQTFMHTPSQFGYQGQCRKEVAPNTTQSLELLSQFYIPSDQWQLISFSSRNTTDNYRMIGKSLSAFLALHLEQPNVQQLPWIIIVHGRNACKNVTLLQMGMAFKSGYNVLSLDLRNNGQSASLDLPYKWLTFGSEEHFDVLGAFDYIQTNYPSNEGVSLLGTSMGGATSLIAFARETNFVSLFLDSAVCNVIQTLQQNIWNHYKVSPDLIMKSICYESSVLSPYGCPPFRYDPMALLSTNSSSTTHRRIEFLHMKQDDMVPLFNAEQCSTLAKAQGYNVTTVFADTGFEGKCYSVHALYMYSNTMDYFTLVQDFFHSTLPIPTQNETNNLFG